MNSPSVLRSIGMLRRSAALLVAAGALLALGACQTTQTPSRAGERVKYVSSNIDFSGTPSPAG